MSTGSTRWPIWLGAALLLSMLAAAVQGDFTQSAKVDAPSLSALTDDLSVEAIAVYELLRAGDPNSYTDVYYSFFGHKPKYPVPFNNITEWKWWTLPGEAVPTAPLPNGFGEDNNRPSIAFSREGYAVAVWDNYAIDSFIPCGFPFPVPMPRSRGHILFSIWNGTEWSPAAIAVQGGPDIIASDPSIAIDSNGNGLLLFSVLEQTRVIGCPTDRVLSVKYSRFFGVNRSFDESQLVEVIPDSPFEPMFSAEIAFSSGLVAPGAHTRHQGVAAWWRPAGTSSRVCPGEDPFTITVDTYWPRKAIWNGNAFEQIDWIPDRMVPDPLLLDNQSTVMSQKIGISSDQFNHTMVVWDVSRQYYAAPSDPCTGGASSESREVWAARWNSSTWTPTAERFALRAPSLYGLDVAYVPENEAVTVYSDWFAGQPEVRWSRFRTDKTWQNRGRLDANNGAFPTVASLAHNRTLAIWTWTAGMSSNILWSVIENKDIAAGAWAPQAVLAPGTNWADLAAHTGSPTLPHAEWTHMAYLAGDTDVEGTVVNDLNETKSAKGSTNLVNIVMFRDSKQANKATYSYMKNPEVVRINLGSTNSANPNTLSNFIAWAIEEYPSDRISIDIGGLGAGWEGISQDRTSGFDWLNATELRNSLKDVSIKFDLIGLSACRSGTLELAYEVEGFADYLISSQENFYGNGINYQDFVNYLTEGPHTSTKDIGEKIVDFYQNSAIGQNQRDYTIALLNVSRIPSLVNDLNTFSTLMITNFDPNNETIRKALVASTRMRGHPAYVDLENLSQNINLFVNDVTIKAAAQTLLTALDRTVIKNWSDVNRPGVGGLSIFLDPNRNTFGKKLPSYNQTRLANDTSWELFVNTSAAPYQILEQRNFTTNMVERCGPPLTVRGNVQDGHGNFLPFVNVNLTVSGTNYPHFTNEQGNFSFALENLLFGDAQTGSLAPQLFDVFNLISVFDHQNDPNEPTWFRTTAFGLPIAGDAFQPISAANTTAIAAHNSNVNRVDDLSYMYYQLFVAANFTANILNLTMDHALPVEAYAWGPRAGTFYCINAASAACGFNGVVSKLHFSPGDSVITSPEQPSNREWHEFNHHTMADSLIGGDNAFPFRPPGTRNHCMFNNPDSSDSWLEGFAEGVPLWIAERRNQPNPMRYFWSGGTFMAGARPYDDLELNYRVRQDEEFAVAGLMWDLFDGFNATDNDSVQVSLDQIWMVLNSAAQRNHIYDLYQALQGSGIPILAADADADGISNLDELFVARDVYNDTNANATYDLGEPVGVTTWPAPPPPMAGCPRGAGHLIVNRSGKPPREGSYLNLTVLTPNGSNIPAVTLNVAEANPAPFQDYDHAYALNLSGLPGQVYFSMLPTPSTATLTVSLGNATSATLVVTSDYYWSNLGNGSILTHTFVLDLGDIDAPVVSLVSPGNGSVETESDNVTFSYNVSDAASGIVACVLLVNGSEVQNDTSIIENVTQTFLQTLANGDYAWQVRCTDDSPSQNLGASETWTLRVAVPNGTPGWGNDTRLTFDNASSSEPSLAVDVWGNIHVAWLDWRDDDPPGSYTNAEIYYKKLDNNGNNLTNETRITFDPAYSGYPSIASDQGGNVHVVWYDFRDGPEYSNAEIYYKKLDSSGNSLTPDIRVSFGGGMSQLPSIAVDGNGSVHIVWEDNREDNYEVYYRKLDNNGSSLTPEREVTDSLLNASGHDLGIDADGNLHVAWLDFNLTDPLNNNYTVGLSYKKLDNDGTNLTNETALFLQADRLSQQPSLDVDPGGNVHVAWHDMRDGNPEIYYKKLDNNGNNLTEDRRLTTNPSSSYSPSLSTDHLGNVHIAWWEWDFEAQATRVLYTLLNNNGNALVNGTGLTANLSSNPSLDTDSAGNAHAAWQDYRHGNAEVYYKRSLNISAPPLNGPPVLASIGNRSILEGSTLVIRLNATDPDNDSITFGTNASSVLPSPFFFVPATGFFNWTPTFNDSGFYTVAFNATDGTLWDSETVTITVINVIQRRGGSPLYRKVVQEVSP